MQAQLMVGVRVRAEAAAVLVLGISKYLLVTRAGDVPSTYTLELHNSNLHL
jgi:hypothetical protein